MAKEQEISLKYQTLFNHFRNEHNLILTISEMDEIISECKKVVDEYETRQLNITDAKGGPVLAKKLLIKTLWKK